MIDHNLLEQHGFYFAKEIAGRGVCAISRFVYTTGLVTNLRIEESEHHYDARYCYPDWAEAIGAIYTWDGAGDPPGPWIKEKVSERFGPGANASDEQRAAHEQRRQARWDAHRRGDLGD